MKIEVKETTRTVSVKGQTHASNLVRGESDHEDLKVFEITIPAVEIKHNTFGRRHFLPLDNVRIIDGKITGARKEYFTAPASAIDVRTHYSFAEIVAKEKNRAELLELGIDPADLEKWQGGELPATFIQHLIEKAFN